MKAEESATPGLMDLFSPGFADDPHPAYHRMQAECPVQRSEGMFGGHSVNLSRYEDVMWAMRHPEVFSSQDVVNIGNDMPLIPLSVDPPDHVRDIGTVAGDQDDAGDPGLAERANHPR